MRLVTFVETDQPSNVPLVGALTNDDRVVPLRGAADRFTPGRNAHAFGEMTLLLAAMPDILEEVQQIVAVAEADGTPEFVRPIGSVRLLSPVPTPNSLRDCMAFEQHVLQCMQTIAKRKCQPVYWGDRWARRLFGAGLLRVPRVLRERPIYYKGNRRSVVGTDCDVRWPTFTERLDFELEFGVFIGRGGCNISPDQAHQQIAGYALFNDFSARDVQLREMQGKLGPAKGKDFDTGNAIGPWIVTPDEIGERDLTMTVRVNGQAWSCSSTRSMQHSFSEIIAFVSQDETLYPGDFIASGTLPGGCGLELDRWLAPGDVVELDGGPLGILRNRVVRA